MELEYENKQNAQQLKIGRDIDIWTAGDADVFGT